MEVGVVVDCEVDSDTDELEMDEMWNVVPSLTRATNLHKLRSQGPPAGRTTRATLSTSRSERLTTAYFSVADYVKCSLKATAFQYEPISSAICPHAAETAAAQLSDSNTNKRTRGQGGTKDSDDGRREEKTRADPFLHPGPVVSKQT
eukprot:3324309-Amphidinium_carterae.2